MLIIENMRDLFLLIFSALLFMAGCASPTAVVTPRQAETGSITADPVTEMTGRMEFHENSGFYYKFEYDDQNLYIQMATSDPAVQRKIVYFGFTVWTDRTGEQKKSQGFRFPVVMTVPQESSRGSGPGPVAAGLNSSLEWADKIELIGIYGNSVRRVKRRDSRIRVVANFDDDVLIYKAVVPYQVLKHGYDPAEGAGKMSIGFETGHFEPEEVQKRETTPGMRNPGNGMRPRGGMPGTMQGGMQGRMIDRDQWAAQRSVMNAMSRPTRLWIDIEFLSDNN